MSRSISERVVIAAPCSADWDSMPGDEKVRACGQCKQNVFNLSAMSETEAEQFLQKAKKIPCLRFFRRQDGTIMFDNCPVGLRRVRDAVKQSLRIASVFLAWVISFSCVFAKDKKSTPEKSSPENHINFTWTLSESGPWPSNVRMKESPKTEGLQMGSVDRFSFFTTRDELGYMVAAGGSGTDSFSKALHHVDRAEYTLAEIEFEKALREPDSYATLSNGITVFERSAHSDPQYLEFVAVEYGKLLRKTGREKEATEVEERYKFKPKHVSMDITTK